MLSAAQADTPLRWATNGHRMSAYSQYPAVGKQYNSALHSAPIFGFGSSTRDHMAKVFVSHEHAKTEPGNVSPGPVYSLEAAIGKQTLSRKEGQPAWVMGKAERFNFDDVKRAATSPGPGAYASASGIGPQVSSSKTSTPRYGFGTSNREHREKVYISAEHDKTSGGKSSPGPGQYPSSPMTGAKVASSRSRTAPTFGFGTAVRFSPSKKATNEPGPGDYVI